MEGCLLLQNIPRSKLEKKNLLKRSVILPYILVHIALYLKYMHLSWKKHEIGSYCADYLGSSPILEYKTSWTEIFASNVLWSVINFEPFQWTLVILFFFSRRVTWQFQIFLFDLAKVQSSTWVDWLTTIVCFF